MVCSLDVIGIVDHSIVKLSNPLGSQGRVVGDGDVRFRIGCWHRRFGGGSLEGGF